MFRCKHVMALSQQLYCHRADKPTSWSGAIGTSSSTSPDKHLLFQGEHMSRNSASTLLATHRKERVKEEKELRNSTTNICWVGMKTRHTHMQWKTSAQPLADKFVGPRAAFREKTNKFLVQNSLLLPETSSTILFQSIVLLISKWQGTQLMLHKAEYTDEWCCKSRAC